ncbi:hypothetical protein INR49_028227 [Caranx melampygus]|nr:hypothetical protein INR49_028227 [Caranx melampygus]
MGPSLLMPQFVQTTMKLNLNNKSSPAHAVLSHCQTEGDPEVSRGHRIKIGRACRRVMAPPRVTGWVVLLTMQGAMGLFMLTDLSRWRAQSSNKEQTLTVSAPLYFLNNSPNQYILT